MTGFLPKLDFSKGEGKLLKSFLSVSVGVHFFLFVAGSGFFFSSSEDRKPIEWEIDAELAVGYQGKGAFDAIDRAIKGEEIKVNKQILPQLTKSMQVEVEKKQKSADLGDAEFNPDDERLSQKKKVASTLKKKEALRRLLKERARRENKFADKTTSPLVERLQARKRELIAGNDFSLGSEKSVDRFRRDVQILIKRYYSLPEVYRFTDKNLKAGISVKLDLKGQIVDIKVSRSSGNQNLDSLAIETIKKAAPLPVPPKDIVGKSFIINFNP